jgi:hypothetical protein
MTTFTIDTDNNITAWATTELAQASIEAGAQPFSSPVQLAELATGWPAERLLTIWNSLPGVTPAKRFKNPKTAASRIWERIQGLSSPEAPKQDKKLKPLRSGAPAQPSRKARAKKSSKASGAKAKHAKDAAPREGTKKAQVITLLERKGGATLTEIMKKMGWQQHTVRGFMAGAMKKAGYRVESFKPEGGERSYRLKS